MVEKEDILSTLKKLKPIYEKEGLILIGLFGSYAKGEQSRFSDIDISYKLDYEKFNNSHVGGFSKLLRIDSIKEDLEKMFHKKVDFVPDNNTSIVKDLIYV